MRPWCHLGPSSSGHDEEVQVPKGADFKSLQEMIARGIVEQRASDVDTSRSSLMILYILYNNVYICIDM